MSFGNVVSDQDCHLTVIHIRISHPIQIGSISKRRRSLQATPCDLENGSDYEANGIIVRHEKLELDHSRWEKRIRSMEGSEVDVCVRARHAHFGSEVL